MMGEFIFLIGSLIGVVLATCIFGLFLDKGWI